MNARTHRQLKCQPRRRHFAAEYKRKILLDAEAAESSGRTGELAALLRRSGLFSSHLTHWGRERARGELEALTPKKRGPKATLPDERDRLTEDLKRQRARATARAEHADALVDIQKNWLPCWGDRWSS